MTVSEIEREYLSSLQGDEQVIEFETEDIDYTIFLTIPILAFHVNHRRRCILSAANAGSANHEQATATQPASSSPPSVAGAPLAQSQPSLESIPGSNFAATLPAQAQATTQPADQSSESAASTIAESKASGDIVDPEKAAHICLNDDRLSDNVCLELQWYSGTFELSKYDIQLAVDPAIFETPEERRMWTANSTPRRVNFYSSLLQDAPHLSVLDTSELGSAAVSHRAPGWRTFCLSHELLRSLTSDFEDIDGRIPGQQTNTNDLPTRQAPRIVTVYARIFIRAAITMSDPSNPTPNGQTLVVCSETIELTIGHLMGFYEFRGLRGDVLKIDFSATRESDFQLMPLNAQEPTQIIAGATIVRDDRNNQRRIASEGGEFATTGIFFIAPDIDHPPMSTSVHAGRTLGDSGLFEPATPLEKSALDYEVDPAGTFPWHACGPRIARFRLRSVREGTSIERPIEVRIFRGYSEFTLTGNVDLRPDGRRPNQPDNADALRTAALNANPVDITRIQQRLRYFNYPGRNTTLTSEYAPPFNNVADRPVIVNGRSPNELKIADEALRLFIASTQHGEPSERRLNWVWDTISQEVIPGEITHQWLNARNAPWWIEIEAYYANGAEPPVNPTDEQMRTAARLQVINGETWATSWAIWIIHEADRLYRRDSGDPGRFANRVTSLSEYPDLNAPHLQHKNGMQIDWTTSDILDQSATLDGGRPNPDNNGIFPASVQPNQRFDQLRPNQQVIVRVVRSFRDAARSQDIRCRLRGLYFGGNGLSNTATFPRVNQVIRENEGVAVTNCAPHHHHLHFMLVQPTVIVAVGDHWLNTLDLDDRDPYYELPWQCTGM